MKTHTNHSYIFVILCLRLSSECETPCSLEHPALITIVVISIFTTVNRYRNAVNPKRREGILTHARSAVTPTRREGILTHARSAVRALAEAFMFGRANRWSVGQAVTSVSVNLKSSLNFP